MPAFEFGVWNAWLFMGPSLVVMLLCLLVMTKKGAPGGPARVPCKSKTTLFVASLSKVIYVPAVLYSVFLPLQLGTMWFYVGLPIALVGVVGGLVVLVDWTLTPAGVPITRGLYRYSRHPMYVTGILTFLGVSLLSASWVFLVLTIIFGIGVTRPYFVKIEEAQCLGQYGAAYREYMNSTPRWIGRPKASNRNSKHE